MIKSKKFTICIVMSLVLGLLIGTPIQVYADSYDDELTTEEQEAKNIVIALKNEMIFLEKQSSESNSSEENMYDQELWSRYQAYLSENKINDTYSSIVAFSSDFAHTKAETRDITVSLIRSSGIQAANVAGALGYKMVCETLKNSLRDNPPQLTWQVGNSFSNELKSSIQYKELTESIKDNLRYVSGNYWNESSSIAFNNPMDVYLSVHNMDYLAAAEKVGGVWRVYIRFFDTYDFDFDSNKNYPSAIIAWINNYAYDAQRLGALVPYDIVAFTQESYYI